MEIYKRGILRVTFAELERSFESYFPFDTTVYVRKLRGAEKTYERMSWYGVYDAHGHKKHVFCSQREAIASLRSAGLTVYYAH